MALAAAWHGGSLFARADNSTEVDLIRLRKVKAAYLLNFAKFIEWPSEVFASADAPFQIGIVGADPFGDILDETVRGRTVGGRQLMVRRFNWARREDQAAAAACQILYVGDWRDSLARTVASTLGNKPVLLVGEGGDFGATGGSIGFSVEAGRVIFSVDRRALAARKLNASSQLLKVARVIDAATSQPSSKS